MLNLVIRKNFICIIPERLMLHFIKHLDLKTFSSNKLELGDRILGMLMIKSEMKLYNPDPQNNLKRNYCRL